MEETIIQKTCKSCKHFRQHYIKHGNSYNEISYGHCVSPRLKKRDSETPACENYNKRPQAKKKDEED